MQHLKGSPTTRLMTLAISVLLVSTSAATAQTAPRTAASSAPIAAATPDYHPSLGDLMTMAIQPRHTKLALAGQQGNWPYAQYELSELRNAFARVARTIPIYRNIDMTAVIAGLTTEPLTAVERAIKAENVRQFNAAYAALTTACNACHLSQDHAAVVIQVPGTNPYPDQDFRRPVH